MTDTSRLQEIQQEIKELVREAKQIVRGTHEAERAKAYWLAQLTMALDDDHMYCGSGSVTMQNTIDALSGDEDDAD